MAPLEERDGPRGWYREHRAGIIARLAEPCGDDGRRSTALVVLALDDDPGVLARAEAARRVDSPPLLSAR